MTYVDRKEHYWDEQYLQPGRLLAYLDQISLLRRFSQPYQEILEVGKGNGYFSDFVQNYLKRSIYTVDILPELNPDFCQDIGNIQFELPRTFDVGVCFEVLEHLSWERLKNAVHNLQKYVLRNILISVPDTNFFLQLNLNRLFWKYIRLNFTFSVPRLINNKSPIGKSHVWEIGIFHQNRRISANILIKEVFGISNVVWHGRGRYFPGHHFFVLKGAAKEWM